MNAKSIVNDHSQIIMPIVPQDHNFPQDNDAENSQEDDLDENVNQIGLPGNESTVIGKINQESYSKNNNPPIESKETIPLEKKKDKPKFDSEIPSYKNPIDNPSKIIENHISEQKQAIIQKPKTTNVSPRRPQTVQKMHKREMSFFTTNHKNVDKRLDVSMVEITKKSGKMDKEIQDLQMKNADLKQEIDHVKNEKKIFIKETEKVNKEIETLLKSKEMAFFINFIIKIKDSKYLMKQEEEIGKIKASIKKYQQMLKSIFLRIKLIF